jgi:dienelactone hydrolase
MRLLLVMVTMLSTMAASAGAEQSVFSYDARIPLGVARATSQTAAGVVTTPLSFNGLAFGTVHGVLVAPAVSPAGGTGPGILWVHWLGDAATSNHTEFLPEAQRLAAEGVTSLLVDALWSNPAWYEKRDPAGDEQALTAQVIALRRSLDVLLAQPAVDPARIAYVGHDFGAMYGALAVAADGRVHKAVFMTPSPTFWEWMLFGPVPKDIPAYVARMSVYDLPRQLAGAQLSASLWQFGKRDPYVSLATASQIKAWAPPAGRTIAAYDADHDLAAPKASADRLAWLEANLGLTAAAAAEAR